MVVLLLLGVRWLWTPGPTSPWFADWLLRNPWRESNAPALLVRTQILLAVWLWVTHRSQRLCAPEVVRRGLVGLLAAGTLLLVLAYAVLVSVRPPLSSWELTRIHP